MAKDKSTKAKADTKPAKAGKAAKAEAPKGKAKAGKGDANHGITAPGSGAGGQFTAADEVGNLLLITPQRVEHDIDTSNGSADATRADIVVLDKDGRKAKPRVINDTLIFQKVVQGQLREAVENKTRVVGRLFIDEASKKKGQTAPFKLAAPTEADIKLAVAYLDSLDPLR